MLSPAQKKRLNQIDEEWIAVITERSGCDFTPRGQARWDELWAKCEQLRKERNALVKETVPE